MRPARRGGEPKGPRSSGQRARKLGHREAADLPRILSLFWGQVAGVAALMYQTGLYNQGTSAGPEAIRAKIRASANRRGLAPLDSVAAGYSYDGEREGVVNVVGSLAP